MIVSVKSPDRSNPMEPLQYEFYVKPDELDNYSINVDYNRLT